MSLALYEEPKLRPALARMRKPGSTQPLGWASFGRNVAVSGQPAAETSADPGAVASYSFRPSYRSMEGNGGLIQRYRDYFQHAWAEEYAPWKDIGKNAKGYVKARIAAAVLGGLAAITASTPALSAILGGPAKAFRTTANVCARDLSPLLRTLTIGYGSGKTDIERIWAYKVGNKKFPIHFSTYQKPDAPTTEQLQQGITYVDTNGESPFNDMERGVTDDLVNKEGFITYSADAYTANCYADHYAEEPRDVHRFFVKEETKGHWIHDTASEAGLGPLQGRIEIYKKPVSRSGFLYWLGRLVGDDRPKSGEMAMRNILGSIPHHILYPSVGIPLAMLLQRLGVEAPGVRDAMQRSIYKPASKMGEAFGLRRNFVFETA